MLPACPHPEKSTETLKSRDAKVPFDMYDGSQLKPECPFWVVFFYGGPAHLLGFCSLLVAMKTRPGSASQAVLSFLLLLQRREQRLQAGLKWLFSSRSLRKNKIWFAIPCSTCAGSSALRAGATAFCPWSVCD